LLFHYYSKEINVFMKGIIREERQRGNVTHLDVFNGYFVGSADTTTDIYQSYIKTEMMSSGIKPNMDAKMK